MNVHKNARLTPLRREEMALAVIEGSLSQANAAVRYGVTAKIVARWVERYKTDGQAGMADRSSRPARSPKRTDQSTAERIVALRRERRTGKHIAQEVGVSPATVSRVLKRAGLSRLKDLDPAEPVVRYERAHPGEMIHIDIKKLGRFERVGHRITGDRKGQSNSRGIGCEFVHIAIDDASRIAFSQILPDEKKESAIVFLRAALAYYAGLGVVVIHAADIQDRDGAPAVLKSILTRWPWLRHVFADGGYAGPKLRGALQKIGKFTMEIVKRSDSAKGFEVLPRRWVVERTFAWLGRCRRLAKDFERSIESAQAWVFIANIRMLTRRLARA
ncbi:MAG: LacI family DNA-binding transcriptional regulator [Mesorhizobium sp.]|uniref:transposase n=1 Tax=Mesorhizobium sp. TaxID=1871066 RepID=UPI000FE46923|nr:transposase [Mesorhizobium sp.]RWI57090.1 MAG: LacI family DNA-binding transcriptional regulator [Mesorhizobium sp.]